MVRGCFGAELWLIRWARSRRVPLGRKPATELAGASE